jgi:hypothetical protein
VLQVDSAHGKQKYWKTRDEEGTQAEAEGRAWAQTRGLQPGSWWTGEELRKTNESSLTAGVVWHPLQQSDRYLLHRHLFQRSLRLLEPARTNSMKESRGRSWRGFPFLRLFSIRKQFACC